MLGVAFLVPAAAFLFAFLVIVGVVATLFFLILLLGVVDEFFVALQTEYYVFVLA